MNNRDLFKKFMCGMMSVAMIASASTAVLATTTEADYIITSVGTEKEITYLYGVVVEVISETSIMVDWHYSSYGRTVVYCDDMPNLQAGSYVYVESDGIFMESYPMQLNAYKVSVLEATTTEPVYNPEESTQTTVVTTYDGQYTTQITDVLTSESETTKAPKFILTNGLITKINLDANRMMVDDRYIFDYIAGTEIGDVVDLVMVNGVIYDIWATPYE
ncbi:MAG: DUF3221 domain-containing protein, partial [Clostridiales bacterium]|nr:DUF3221 domain-containing protein [Clostridiales bacterium]